MHSFKRSIRPIDGTQTGTTYPDKSGPGSKSNEGILNALQIFRSGASPSDTV